MSVQATPDDGAPRVAPTGGLSLMGLADVPRARHYVADQLRGRSGDGDLLDLAELVVTELVTNALLHGRKPVTLRLTRRAGVALVEVHDASPVLPETGLSGEEEMTGRGLALIEALAERWGATPTGDGKVVWCELADPSAGESAGGSAEEPPRDRTTPGPTPTAPPAAGVTVELRDVPVDLLLALESHVDDLIRDLTLAGSSRSEHRDAEVPAVVASRVAAAAERLAAERRTLKRAAADGRSAGSETIAVRLPIGPEAVAAQQEYLAALEEADNYCRAARLLTLEAPPSHRVLRRWMADQVETATRAQPDAPRSDAPFTPEPLHVRLLDEISGLAAVQRAAARSARLYRVATGLSDARTPEQVAGVVLEEGTAALGAARGALLRLVDGQVLLVGTLGLGAAALDRARTVALSDRLPSTDALRTREPVWVESLAERDRRYPELSTADPGSRAVVAAPLLIGENPLGVLRFGFDTDLVVDDDERSFVRALAAQAASALDRALSYAAEQQARQEAERNAERLRTLQRLTAALAGTTDEDEVFRLVLDHATSGLGARIGTICLLERPGPVQTLAPDAVVRIAHRFGLTTPLQRRWQSFTLGAPVPVSDVIRSGEPIVLTTAERDARYPVLRDAPSEDHLLAVMPLAVGARRLGALTLSFFDGRPFGNEEQSFLASLADACAQALDRALAVSSLRTASAHLAFLAEASVHLARTLDPAPGLLRVAHLAVPLLADHCVVATADGLGALQVLHDGSDVGGQPGSPVADEMEALFRAGPEFASDPTGGAPGDSLLDQAAAEAEATAEPVAVQVLRTGRSLLLDRRGALRSVLLVPMTARGRALGVLALATVGDGRVLGAEELAVAEDLARRAALAVDNATLLARRASS